MDDFCDEELGPIDWVVVEFPAGESKFNGEMARELAALAEAELVRILDLLIVTRDADGELDVTEFEDMGDRDSLQAFEGQMAEILALEDIENVAEAMEPGSAAGVLVWENRWAAPFAVSARRSGGQLLASGRIPTQALIAAVTTTVEDSDMPIRRGRVGRRGVIGRPVARTAGVVATTAVVAQGVSRRSEQRGDRRGRR